MLRSGAQRAGAGSVRLGSADGARASRRWWIGISFGSLHRANRGSGGRAVRRQSRRCVRSAMGESVNALYKSEVIHHLAPQRGSTTWSTRRSKGSRGQQPALDETAGATCRRRSTTNHATVPKPTLRSRYSTNQPSENTARFRSAVQRLCSDPPNGTPSAPSSDFNFDWSAFGANDSGTLLLLVSAPPYRIVASACIHGGHA